MKTFFTLLMFGFIAALSAQTTTVQNEQGEIRTAEQATAIESQAAEVSFESITEPIAEDTIELARLFKSKNALVKKELSFRTYAHKSKLV